MSNIFIVTSSFDLTSDYIINKYSKKHNFFRFNIDKYDRYLLNISNNNITVKDSLEREYVLNEDVSIWFRKPTLPKFKMNVFDLEFTQKEIYAQMEGLIECHDGIVIEKPCILRRANNKVLQLKIAEKIGFIMPQSHISNDRSVVLGADNHGQQIIKPISTGKIGGSNSNTFIQTELLTNDDQLLELRFCPSYFQKYIEKDYEIRLTVVGEQFFGVKIESQNKIDWRKERNNKLSCIDVLVDIKNRCLDMMNRLNIKFGAFDFIVSNGEYYFLEVNPNGQWLWLEQKLNLNISDAIVSILTK